MIHFPDKSEAENAEFSAMLDEIHNHLVYVLQEKLGWNGILRPEMSVGGGHVVIRFEKEGQRLVFRVPKHGVAQLKRSMLAYRHLGHLGFMPEKIYHDGKCIIERHAEGIPISPQVPDHVLMQLAIQLAKMHALPAQGFGPLDFDFQGSHEDAAAYYRTRPPITVDRSETDLSSAQADALGLAQEQAAILPPDLLAAPACVGHGDLWRNNILVDQDSFKIIDWDRIGAYPREYDLVFLIDADLSAHQRALFFESYGHAVNFSVLKWFAKRRTLLNGALRLPRKIQKIQEIDLI